MNKKWGGVNAFYTLSRSISDDDNERDAGGVLYSNPYNFGIEYYNSKLDRRHQFVANPRFNLPGGIEISSAIRFRSGVPVNSLVGGTGSFDVNGDSFSNERPMIAPGVELKRNWFTNLPTYDIDLRVQKSIHFGETQGQFDVLLKGHARKEVERLKNHTDSAAAITRQLERVHLGKITALREDGAGGGAIQTRHEV